MQVRLRYDLSREKCLLHASALRLPRATSLFLLWSSVARQRRITSSSSSTAFQPLVVTARCPGGGSWRARSARTSPCSAASGLTSTDELHASDITTSGAALGVGRWRQNVVRIHRSRRDRCRESGQRGRDCTIRVTPHIRTCSPTLEGAVASELPASISGPQQVTYRVPERFRRRKDKTYFPKTC